MGEIKNENITTKSLSTIQINHQPRATIFQFIILTFIYSATCFGRFPAHHQELDDYSGSLWFYLRIVVTVVMCMWSDRLTSERASERAGRQAGTRRMFSIYYFLFRD
jgi:hypothetical protein